MSAEKKYDILVAGELNVDIILNQIDVFPEIGKEVLAEQMTMTLGSSSAIFASNISVLGSRVAFCGTLARDHFGEHILTRLSSKGVNTDNIVFTKKKSTGATIVLNTGEERAMITYPGAMTLFGVDNIPDDLFHQSRHLHVSSIFLSTGLKKDVQALFRKAKSFGLTTSLDPQWDPAGKWDIDFKALLADVDIFLPNRQELSAITGIEDMDEAVESLRAHDNIFIVKSGAEGSYLWHANDFIHQPAFLNANVVDSIGAGDSFDAGFVHAFVQGMDLNYCLEFAAIAGAINTTRPGGTTAFESLEVASEIARTHFQYKI